MCSLDNFHTIMMTTLYSCCLKKEVYSEIQMPDRIVEVSECSSFCLLTSSSITFSRHCERSEANKEGAVLNCKAKLHIIHFSFVAIPNNKSLFNLSLPFRGTGGWVNSSNSPPLPDSTSLYSSSILSRIRSSFFQ